MDIFEDHQHRLHRCQARESVRPPPQINALATGVLAVREDFEVSAGS
jgi:hypothetical protein